jgi:membrane protease subunit (stomatin/prohibitin family)
MPFLSREFIAVPDERKDQILFKWPDDELRKGTRCIVEPDMQAVFISKGKVVGTLGPGRHQVQADELPGLGALIDAVTGGDAYRAELYFVGTHEYVGQKFGGRIDDIQDPQSQLLVGMRVFGDYSVRVTDPAKLILQLTGTVDVTDNDAITGWIGEQLLKAMRQLVAKNVITGTWPVVSTAAFSSDIETGSLTQANNVVADYGLQLIRLGNFDISLVPEDEAKLKALAEDIRRSQLAGGYAQMAQVEMMRGAGAGLAQGGGNGAAFIGLGAGVGQAAMTPPAPGPAPTPMPLVPQGQPPAAGTHSCPSCQQPVADSAKFCAACGTAQPQPGRHCTACGTELAPGAGFCSQCGTKQEA